MSERLQWELEKLSFQIKFIKLIIDGEMKVTNRPRKQIVADLEERGFPRFNKEGKPSYTKPDGEDMEEQEEEQEKDEDDNVEDVINGPEEVHGSFEYLLGMKIWALTRERYERLLKQKQEREAELETLLQYSAKDLWTMDLDEFVTAYDKFMSEDEEARNGEIPGAATKGKGKKKRKADQDDSEYNPNSKKSKTSKKTPKKVKDEEAENFQRVLLEPKAIAVPKAKRPSKVKAESETSLPPSSEESDSKKSDPPPTLVKTEPKEEPEKISAFSSKFKKLSAAFDSSTDSKSNDGTGSPGTIKTENSDDKKLESKATTESTTAKTKRKSSPMKQESESAGSDISDDDDEPVAVPERTMRKRPSRATAASKKSYQEIVDLSDDSFDDGEKQVPDEDGGDDDDDDVRSEEDQSYNEDEDDD